MGYIYTFHSHFYAMRFHKKVSEMGLKAVIMPVPRRVSSSCGSCVKLTNIEDPKSLLDDGVEQLFETENDTHTLIYEAE